MDFTEQEIYEQIGRLHMANQKLLAVVAAQQQALEAKDNAVDHVDVPIEEDDEDG